MGIPSVVCLKTGTKFTPDYVTKLRNMVERHLPMPYRFVCFTDDPVDGVDCRPPLCDLPGWWGKVGFFRNDWEEIHPDLAGLPMLFLDLDMLVVGDLEEVFETEEDFLILKQWKPKLRHPMTIRRYNSSVIYWARPGNRPRVWEDFGGLRPLRSVKNGFEVNVRGDEREKVNLRGDQDWIAFCYYHEETFPQDWFPPFETLHTGGPKRHHRVVICNSHDPHIIAPRYPWVRKVWR